MTQSFSILVASDLSDASGHVYSYQRELPFAQHDSEIVRTGIQF
jgi:hypothetical protein